MSESILNSTKKVLGLEINYNAFDLDITTHINAAFSTLNQLGVGPVDGFYITGNEETWTDIGLPSNQLHLAKSYIYLKVRSLFDPPATSFLIASSEKQLQEFEWRLNMFREVALPDPVPEETDDDN